MIPTTHSGGQYFSRARHRLLRRRAAAALCAAAAVCAAAVLLFASHHSGGDEIYSSATSDRVVELRAGTAYITEGLSTQAVPYEVQGERIILHLPFMDMALRRLPDGSLSGMGEALVRIDASTAALLGTYQSVGGDYRLHLGTGGQAVYTRLGQPETATYTLTGNQIVLRQGSHDIPIKRRPDGSLETADAVLQKLS